MNYKKYTNLVLSRPLHATGVSGAWCRLLLLAICLAVVLCGCTPRYSFSNEVTDDWLADFSSLYPDINVSITKSGTRITILYSSEEFDSTYIDDILLLTDELINDPLMIEDIFEKLNYDADRQPPPKVIVNFDFDNDQKTDVQYEYRYEDGVYSQVAEFWY